MRFRNQVLSLHSDALPADTLMVAKLTGHERLSGLFRFDIDLICNDRELDLEAVLYAPAKLSIKVQVRSVGGTFGTTTREIAGVFEEFEELDEGQGWTRYRAVLVPKLWCTTRHFRSRIFQDLTIEELVTAVLEKDGLSPGIDFEFRLDRAGDEDPATRAIYPRREYVVQYEESDWQFLARWLEHEGIWFAFVNEDGTEKVVFADSEASYGTSPFGSSYPYRPDAKGDGADSDKFTEEEVQSLRCKQTRLPTSVTVNDYNWRAPDARLLFHEDVREGGTGLQAQYNDHFKTEAQGKALARVRKEELACRAQVFQGTSSCRAFRPGTTYTLEGHFRDDFNRRYLLTYVEHSAEQMLSLESSSVTGFKYSNTFHAIADDRAWRPERTTEWPSIKGVMHAKVDAGGDGQYAELDEHGRYKLRMPFDEHADDAEPGKASRWVRMAQPYAGANAGMHFPLLKGTEVLIVHIDGDPDRPVISGAVPNPSTESPTTGSTYTRNTLRTASGNVMKFDDNRNASGFVFADATGSRVCDYRWRTRGELGGIAAGNTPGGGSGTGTPPPTGGGGTGGTGGTTTPPPTGGTGGTTTPPPTTGGTGGTTTPPPTTGGTGGTTAPPPTTGGTGGTTTPPAPPPDPTGEIISTIWDEGVDESDGAAVAWRAYFRGDGSVITAVNQLSSAVKRFAGESSAIGLSASADGGGALLTNTTLSEANIAKMFNELVKDIGGNWGGSNSKNRFESSTYTGTDDGGLNGKIAKLVQSARNFEATASGSTIGIDVGDTIKVSVGDQFEYVDGSYDVKIGTGGYSREETRGDGAKDTYRWGDSEEYEETRGDTTKRSWYYGKENEHSYFFGRKEKWELECSGSASMAVKVSGESENSINIGIFEKFELHLAGAVETSIFGGGKLEIEVGAVMCKLAATVSTEFELSLSRFLINEDEVFLKKMASALSKSDAVLDKTDVALTKKIASLDEKKAGLLRKMATLSDDDASLDKKQAVLNKKMAALASDKAALTLKKASLNDNRVALSNMSTSAFHSLQ